MRNTIKIRLPAILIGLLLFLTACDKNEIITGNLNPEMPPFEISENTALDMVNEAVAYSSIGMLFDIKKGAEVAFDHLNGPSKASRCGTTFTTNHSQAYSYRLLGYESDFHVEILCGPTWSIEEMKVRTHMKPDYSPTEAGYYNVEAFGKWTIHRVAENVNAYPVDGFYIRKGIWRYGLLTHERYNYNFRMDIDGLNIVAANYDFAEAVTATFKLEVSKWSATGEEEKDFVDGIIRFTTNGMFFVEIGSTGNVSS